MGKRIEVISADDAPPRENPHGVDARVLSRTPYAEALQMRLAPGQRLHRHVTPVDVLFWVCSGTGVVEIADEELEVREGTLVESPRGIPHAWRNDSDSEFRVLVLKTPAP
jgi:quercetin dioxygenase-like cupin family protein